MIARNIDKSYRLGVELTAALRPFRGFEWNVNATWSRNRAKDMLLNVIDPDTWDAAQVNMGDTPLAFSPDWIVNNTLRYEYKGLSARLMTKYVSKQYMTKSITVGCTVYNLLNHEYESNGSCGINFRKDTNGNVVPFSNNAKYFYSWATFSAQAPIHALAHVSLNF